MKRFIALVLSLVMALSLCAPAWGAPVADTTAAQAALDAATDGATIELASGVAYSALTVVPTANSNTTYECDAHGAFTDAAAFQTHMADTSVWHGTPTYTTTLKNLTIVGAEGATVAGFVASSGHAHGTVHDYVLNKDVSGSAYYFILKIENLVFENVDFTGNVNICTSQAESVYDGVTFDGCTFTTGGTASGNGAAIRYYNEANNGNVKNLTVKNCYFENCYQGVYTGHVNGITVTDCTFETLGHNAVAVQDQGSCDHGNVVISGNEFKNVGDRVIRFNNVGAGSNITIKNNTATNSGDDGKEVIKATSIASGVTCDVAGNNWGEGAVVVNPEFKAPVAEVNGVGYKTLAEAVAAANDGDTIELLQSVQAPGVVIDSSKYPTKGLTIDLNGFTYDVVAPTVGSSGTETNAFQLLKGGKITFKDGTITSSVAKILIQNYSGLTLLNVNVDGTKLQAPKYALSNNNGDVLITGNTSITAAADGVAFDVYRRSGYAGPSVTVDTTGTITGKVEIATSSSYPPADTNTAELKIKNGNFVGEITKDTASGDKATVAITGGTFSADPKAYVVEGYAATKVDGKYVVAVKKAEADKVETEVKVDVAEPSVEVPVIDTSDMTEKDKTLVENVANSLKEDGVKFDDTALVAAAAEATTTVKNEVTAEEAADLLAEENIPVASDDKVNVVVQPYYDVKVESITVDEDGTASVALNITPMYQTVVTTADVSNDEPIVLPEDEGVTNAVAVGTPKEMTVTKPVTITIAIPAALAVADGDGFKPLYVTHTKEETGVKYVYVAKVEKDGSDYTATFVNPNGFSFFTLSTTNSAVAYVKDSDTSYATIESAISDAGKGAVIEVLVSDQVVNITAPCSFKLKWADNITEPTFNVAKGYTMSKWYVNGVYTYIVQSASAGGYAPVAPSTPDKVVTSADTFDAGIALYVGMSVMAAAGSAVVLKKRED